MLKFIVDANGTPEEIRTVGPQLGFGLEQAAINATKRWVKIPPSPRQMLQSHHFCPIEASAALPCERLNSATCRCGRRSGGRLPSRPGKRARRRPG